MKMKAKPITNSKPKRETNRAPVITTQFEDDSPSKAKAMRRSPTQMTPASPFDLRKHRPSILIRNEFHKINELGADLKHLVGLEATGKRMNELAHVMEECGVEIEHQDTDRALDSAKQLITAQQTAFTFQPRTTTMQRKYTMKSRKRTKKSDYKSGYSQALSVDSEFENSDGDVSVYSEN